MPSILKQFNPITAVIFLHSRDWDICQTRFIAAQSMVMADGLRGSWSILSNSCRKKNIQSWFTQSHPILSKSSRIETITGRCSEIKTFCLWKKGNSFGAIYQHCQSMRKTTFGLGSRKIEPFAFRYIVSVTKDFTWIVITCWKCFIFQSIDPTVLLFLESKWFYFFLKPLPSHPTHHPHPLPNRSHTCTE